MASTRERLAAALAGQYVVEREIGRGGMATYTSRSTGSTSAGWR